MSTYEMLKEQAEMDVAQPADIVPVCLNVADARLLLALVEAVRETETTLINPSPPMQRLWAALARVMED